MQNTLYFYDLETSGIDPKTSRIMQFAGQRTTLDLKPVSEPDNFLIKLTEDVLPDPTAILLTGITPQQTIAEGLSEFEFLSIFHSQIATAGTIFLGFNSIRFDDQFIRFANYRNFFDAYEWQWSDGRGKWDLLDVVRMTRALRPEGIKWPFDSDGKQGNRLEMLSSANNLIHESAHDALSDVRATIALAQLLKTKQPKIFDFLFAQRSKQTVMATAGSNQPFLYTSGKYPAQFCNTTVVCALVGHPEGSGMFVYDLRHDPQNFVDLSVDELVNLWTKTKDDPDPRLPVKLLKYNVCPAIAPLGVLDKPSQTRLQVDLARVMDNFKYLTINKDFAQKVLKAYQNINTQREKERKMIKKGVDQMLFDGFFDDSDRYQMASVRQSPQNIDAMTKMFKDNRLNEMLPLFKARNFPAKLSDEERKAWEDFRVKSLLGGGQNSRMAQFMHQLAEAESNSDLTKNKKYIIEELHLYAQSIMPDASLD